MIPYTTEVRETINRNMFVSLAFANGYAVFLPASAGGKVDVILHREKDDGDRGAKLYKVQIKDRWAIDRRSLDRDLWIAFRLHNEWHLMPHDEMVRVAGANGLLGTASWKDTGRYSRVTPPMDVVIACASFSLGPIIDCAQSTTEEDESDPESDGVQELGGARAVAAFLPIVEQPKFTAGSWCEPINTVDGSMSFPAFDTHPTMSALIGVCDRHGWLKVQYDEAAVDIANGSTDGAAELATAGTFRLAAVMAFLNSAERHTGGGRLSEAVERGLVLTIVRRAAEIAVQEAETPLTAQDRIVGSMLGGAVGDALGAPIEFLSLAKIRERFGPAGLQDLDESGQITDDTQMTLFTAEGLIRARMRALSKGMCHPPAVIHHAYLRWLITQGETARKCAVERNGWLLGVEALHHRRAPGNTCLSALIDAKGLGSPERARNDSKGCGGVMRVAPVGLFAPIIGDDAEVFEVGAASAALTHGHPSGFLASGHLAVVIAALCRGESIDEALDAADRLLAARDGAGEVARALSAARALARRGKPTPEALETLGGGWVAEEALAIAVCCALTADGFDDGVLIAANHSGDSDSTAAIAGNILGARDGVGAIPTAWLDGLEMRTEIARLALDLAKAVDGQELPFEDYPPA